MTVQNVGRVKEVWRYPVQSLRGEMLEAAELGPGGVAGDRLLGLVDPRIDGFVTSARGQRQWRDLVTFSARLRADGAVEVTLPDGTLLASDLPDIEARLSAAIGSPVELKRKGEAAPVYEHAPLHVITTSTLQALAVAAPESCFEPARFRPNLVLEVGEPGFVETGWIGRRLAIGDDVRVEVSEHTKRCVMTTLAQGGLPQDAMVLQTVRERNEARAGVYARVLEPGVLRRGDPVRMIA